MIDFSRKRLGRAKDEGFDPRTLAVAELMAWGWDTVDAMLAVGLVAETDTQLTAQHAAVNLNADPAFIKLFRKRTAQLKGGSVLDEYQKIHPTPGTNRANLGRVRSDGSTRREWQGDVPEPVSDEELLAAMWETIGKLEVGDPKRVDLLDKYDKLKRRQGGSEDDTTIHFYLPRPECDTCPFRGNHIITEPELPEEKNAQEETEEEVETNKPKPGYSVNGKKLGRPRKRHWAVKGRARKQMLAEMKAQEEEEARAEEERMSKPIDLFSLEGEF